MYQNRANFNVPRANCMLDSTFKGEPDESKKYDDS